MGQTIIEKILSQNLGRSVRAGDEALFEPDLTLAYDYPGYIDSYERQMEELGIPTVKKPEKFLFFIDHFNPAGDTTHREVHVKTRNFAKRCGIRLFENAGIGHQVIMEKGYVVPGMMLIHFDGHVSMLGALGAGAISVRNAVIEALATNQVSIMVPGTLRVNLTGRLERGVTARDVFHTLVQRLGPSGACALCIEFGGEGLLAMSMDDRMVLCNQAMFLSAVTAVCEQDEKVDAFLRDTAQRPYSHVVPDKDARYDKEYTLDLATVSPVLVAPPSSANTAAIADYEGMRVDVGYVGSCASGRITDFAQVLDVLEGRHIASETRLYAVPSSVQLQKELAANGMMGKLIDAGACLYYPSCDFCFGMLGTMTAGEVALSTGTLNIPGRMGCTKADIYTASPYTIAASLLKGKITDPRTVF
ncbi:MAG: 3-isopropylmalate dehydratase [Oscillibacter sp.]|jgi:3-isopropylmalate/(R)-2-methylmalate dehydratase large subunit|nr:3-isopropylmalate dehydratase [Oscillibacter sp.]